MNELRLTDRPLTTAASYEVEHPDPTHMPETEDTSSVDQSRSAPQRPRVVIVGAGFGGLEAARALRNVDADVTLIDRRNFHLFQPLLYQVATAALSPGDIAWPIRSMFRRQKNITVLMAEINGIDLNARTVTDGTAVIQYDFLILATGASHSYFGRGEWERHAPGLKTIDDATSLRQRLLSAFEHAELMADSNEKAAQLTTVVVGGGPTGVEMAGAVAELSHRTLSSEFRKIDPKTARIVLIEAGPRLLAAFPEKLSEATRRSLQSMHVEVRTNTMVTACDERGVTVGDNERIDAKTIVWAAGVAASPVAGWLDTGRDRAGRAQVNTDLTVAGHPEIFVIGDTAAVTDKTGRTVPGVAPAAKQMGRYVGKLIRSRVMGERTPEPFVYHHAGDFAMIGRKSAVVSVGKIRLKGFVGWLLWSFAHIWFLIGFRSRLIVAFEWFWSYLTAHRGARLISDRRK
jgi:NADH dehydrogenase